MNLMDIDTVFLSEDEDAVVIIDQTLLPNEVVLKSLFTKEQIWNAIYKLEVRGAPAIGVSAALGMAVLSKGMDKSSYEAFKSEFDQVADYLNSSRPTAVNLSWALNIMKDLVAISQDKAVDEIVESLMEKAKDIRDEDIRVCKAIGENGLSLIEPGCGILTHCNAGKLATVQYGTATAPIYLAQEKGYNPRVYCDETRPLLQGARLTAFELTESGVDTTLICDNMSAMVMKKGLIDAIFVGCDRVAANGDTANKIGTSVVAAVAKQYGVPLYICAPTSTIDMNTPTGEDIVIEERNPDEVTKMWYERPMSHKDVKVFNPAFDVTDASLIAGIVTEYGVAKAPFDKSLKEIMDKKEK